MVAAAAAGVEAAPAPAAEPDPVVADSRRKLPPGQPLAQPLGRLLLLLGPPRSLARVPRRVHALRPVLVPLRQPLGPRRVSLPLGPAMSRPGLALRLAR